MSIQALPIAIQGVRGAFHEEATARYYQRQDLPLQEHLDFKGLVSAVARGEASGIMAIENSIAGTLLNNLTLLKEQEVHISGEVYLRIRQNLLALPGTRLEDISEVHSHPVALAQCTAFLQQRRHWKVYESPDTAYSARAVAQGGLRHIAAIGAGMAATHYGLEILAPEIETDKENYTRFLVIEPGRSATTGKQGAKCSVVFALPHKTGALHLVLDVIASMQANLTKIQSIPILGQPWHYAFCLDFIAEAYPVNEVLQKLLPLVEDLKVLGIYEPGQVFA